MSQQGKHETRTLRNVKPCLENWQIFLNFLGVLEKACRRHAQLVSSKVVKNKTIHKPLDGSKIGGS